MDGKIVSYLYPELKLVHFKGHGEVSYDMIIENIIKLHKHPQWNFDYNTFIDFEDVRVRADLDTVKRYDSFFENLQHTTPPRKWAIYTRNMETHNNANMSHLLTAMQIDVDVFLHREDALAFLGVTADQLPEKS